MLTCRRSRVSALVLVLFSLLAPYNLAAQQRVRASTTTARPRLILLIAADQFRYDYLERFGDLFVETGLKRLLREGASWADANYDHVPTYTAPGHATMLTGAYPAATGIVANDWPDRDSIKKVSSVSDENAKLLGSDRHRGGGQSPAFVSFDYRRRTAASNQRSCQSHWHVVKRSLRHSSCGTSR